MNDSSWPDSLLLQLIHPTSPELDSMIPLAGSNGYYSAIFTRPAGRYYVTLTDAAGNWRLAGELGRDVSALQLSAGQ